MMAWCKRICKAIAKLHPGTSVSRPTSWPALRWSCRPWQRKCLFVSHCDGGVGCGAALHHGNAIWDKEPQELHLHLLYIICVCLKVADTYPNMWQCSWENEVLNNCSQTRVPGWTWRSLFWDKLNHVLPVLHFCDLLSAMLTDDCFDPKSASASRKTGMPVLVFLSKGPSPALCLQWTRKM